MIQKNPAHGQAILNLVMILFLNIAPSGCQVDEEYRNLAATSPQGIIDGTETNYQKWKGVVGLYIPGDMMDHICTGTLIDAQVILTAGHCVYMPDQGIDVVNAYTSDVEIRGGANMEILYTYADWIVIHENWKADIQDPYHVDLAMIYLEEPITDIENYGITGTPLELRQKGVIVGYGNNTNFGGDQVHREGDTHVIELPFGNRVFELGHPTGTCRGDSGGPFFVQEQEEWVVAGVTSYGVGSECLTHQGNWNVRVHTYRDWIDNIMVRFTGHGLTSTTDSSNDRDTDTGTVPFGMDSTNPVACRALPSLSSLPSHLFPLLRSLL